MPYIVTTTTLCHETTERGDGPATQHWDEVTRRAVATLDDGRIACFSAIAAGPRYTLPNAAVIANAIHDMPEVGGTVGPLPDGTVIEVAFIDIGPLADMADAFIDGVIPDVPRERDAAVIDAYNAAQ